MSQYRCVPSLRHSSLRFLDVFLETSSSDVPSSARLGPELGQASDAQRKLMFEAELSGVFPVRAATR